MRLLAESRFTPGAWNMAVDCAVAEAVGRGQQLPTLRLYGWQPFCLSLGYGQRIAEADMAALKGRGWDMVRRPSGGKAILHGDELTYSLSLPLSHELARGDVVTSYRRISAGLAAGLEILGLSARAEPKDAHGNAAQTGPVCFVVPSHYEIEVGGRKLIGSAQVRRSGAMMQHGTLPLHGDIGRICNALAFGSDEERESEARIVRKRATTLCDALGRTVSWSEAAAAMRQGFEKAFCVEFAAGELSSDECKRADELLEGRFGNPDYTAKR